MHDYKKERERRIGRSWSRRKRHILNRLEGIIGVLIVMGPGLHYLSSKSSYDKSLII